ncbi:unknown [Coprococcus sp. CAG:131]|nr:unknown [Coprococcus sp. CAG:131]
MASIIAMIFAALRDRSVTSLNTKNDTRFTAVVIPPAITYLTISFSISFFILSTYSFIFPYRFLT